MLAEELTLHSPARLTQQGESAVERRPALPPPVEHIAVPKWSQHGKL